MTTTEVEPGLLQIGESLRAAREGLGLSLEQVAGRLHCDERVLESLEAGRFADVGPPVFARGHLQRYAAMLGESGDAMVSAWAHSAGAGAASELMADTHPRKIRDLRVVRRRLVAGTAILCGLIVAAWSLQRLSAGGRPDAGAPGGGDASSPTAAAPAPGRPATTTAGGETPAPTPVVSVDAAPVSGPAAPVVAAALPAADATPAVAAAVATATPAGAPEAAAAGQAAPVARLAVTATAESWLEVYDRRNRRLYFGVARPGTLVDLRGRLPLRVVVGNVPATTFELDGRRVEVPREAMRGRRAATFRVGADGRLSAMPRA